MDFDFVEVIKKHIENGPSWKMEKNIILEMCERLGIKTLDQFYDVLIESMRCGCSKNFWQHLHGPCLDSEGDHIAYGKDEISKALNIPEKDLTCTDICEVAGSCAYINRVASKLFFHLAELIDDKGLNNGEGSNNNSN